MIKRAKTYDAWHQKHLKEFIYIYVPKTFHKMRILSLFIADYRFNLDRDKDLICQAMSNLFVSRLIKQRLKSTEY